MGWSMKYKYVLLFSIFYSISVLQAQSLPAKLRIQEIVFTDSILVREIKNLIQHEINNKEDKNDFFKRGLGYINLHLANNLDRDVLIKYYISPGMSGFRKSTPDNLYPFFYSYVGNRMILIHLDEFSRFSDYRFSKRSKRQFRKKLEPYLEKTQNIKAYDSLGNVTIRDRHFRMDWFRLHSGRYIYIFNDRPPLVLNEREEEIKQLKSNK